MLRNTVRENDGERPREKCDRAGFEWRPLKFVMQTRKKEEAVAGMVVGS